ncbi:hypothetical protein EV426DRAFT_579036 [Tirmania nivea]|nr:hypothetical protein EV426DRAFT_579036 [Tirmania nivea]
MYGVTQLRTVEEGERKMRAAVERITPITQQQIVLAVRETMQEELRTTRAEWTEMLRRASQQRPLQSPPPAPFRIAPENVNMHAPAPVLTVAMLPTVSPRVTKMVEGLRRGFGIRQAPTVINKPTSMSDCRGAEVGVSGEEDGQRVEVKALFRGLDAISTQEGSLGLTQVPESQFPGSFPAESTESVGVVVPAVPVVAAPVAAESATLAGVVVPAVPVAAAPVAASVVRAGAVRRMSFSSEGSDAGRDDPSFIRRVRQEWEAGSST